MAESAFVAFVTQAEALVGDLRAQHDPSALQQVSAHITVLYPFMEPAALSAHVLQRCAALIASHQSFSFALPSVGRFPATAYLEPVPPQPFIQLTHALWHAYPAFPPFRGEFPTVVPHLTVAHGNAIAAGLVASELAGRLDVSGPVRAACTSLALIENSSGHWRQLHVFPLAPEPGV